MNLDFVREGALMKHLDNSDLSRFVSSWRTLLIPIREHLEDNMKVTQLIIIGFAGLSVSACGATTGGVAKSIAQKSAVNAVTSKVVSAPTTEVVQRPTLDTSFQDVSMDCAALTTQMAELDTTIEASNVVIAESESSKMTNDLAKAGASAAASKALSKIPFAGMFAKSAVKNVMNQDQVKLEKAQLDIQDANLRKANLSGLYAGKNCGT